MKKLSEYTIASNCADIVDCQDGVAEIREEIGRRYKKKQDVPLYFYSRLDKLEKKLEKLAMKNYGMSYREAVIKFGYDNLRGMGKTSDEEKMKKSLKFKVGDYIEHTASAPFYHKVTAVCDLYYTTETYDYVTHQRRGTSKVGIGAQDVYRKIDNPQSDKSDISLFQFAQLLSSRFDDGESYDWAKVQRLAKELGVKSTQQELMQACELAVVLSARQIAHNGQSIAQRFAAMKDLYGQQVTVRPLDTQSKILQQYSTPCPLAFLLGVFVDKNDQFWNGRILEPSAGNGLLTVALHESQTVVNEIDEIRVANLKQLGFASVTSEDASSESAMQKFGNKFRGIITNPPFAKLADKDKIERHGWPINTLDYKMAVLALDRMSDNGKAAIIVGGKMWNSYWKPLSERSEKQVLFGQWKTFLGYLYAQYNVVDVIYINGDNIYRKQGTTYPIVAILVDGRHEYNESVKPNYVFDSERDVIIDTFDQLFERVMPHLDPRGHDKTSAINLLKAIFGKNVRPSGYETTDDNPIHAYKYPTGTMYADTRFEVCDSSGWDFLPVVFKYDNGTMNVKCNVLPEYEQLIDRLKNDDARKRLAKAKAKALLILAFKMKMAEAVVEEKQVQYKHLTESDVAILLNLGYSHDRNGDKEILQIDDCIDYATFSIWKIINGDESDEDNARETTFEKACKLVGRDIVLSGCGRAAFHGWSGGVYREGNGYGLQIRIPKSYWTGGVSGTDSYAGRIKSWLNPADVSYVETLIDVDEKKRLKILEGKFGKKLEPIAVVPRRFMPIIGKDIDDNSVYSSKAYFINHYLHHIDSTKVSDYNIMQNVLIDPDYIVETVIDNKSSYVFVKREGRYNCYIISFERENGKLILHKTFFTQLKKPYKKLARLFEILPEDATFSKEVPSIVHTVKQYTPSDDFMG